MKTLFTFLSFLFIISLGYGQGTESFNGTSSSSSYSSVSWTGDDGSTWNATLSRTDQTINGKAICMNDDKANTYVLSGTISGGIGDFTIKTQRKFSGGSGNLNIEINGTNVGTVAYSSSEQTISINGINISGDFTIKILNNIGGSNSGGADRVAIDDISWTAFSGSSPLITLSETTLTGYSYTIGNGPSAEQTFTIEGSNLTNDISITPPTNYEISTGTGGSFVVTNPITLSQSGGTVSSTTIYTRLKSGLSIADYNNEDITASSLGATDKTVSCSGTVSKPDAPNAFSAATNSSTQIDLTATANGNGDNIMVAYNSTNTFGAPSGSYTVGDAISGGGTVHFVGSAASLTNHASLSPDTRYYYKTWSTDGSNNYSDGITDDAITLKAEPTNHATSFTVTKTGNSSIDISWTDAADVEGYLIVGKTGAGAYYAPVDGTEPSDDTDWSDNEFEVKVASGVQSYSVSSLTHSTTYDFKIYPYNNTGSSINYKTDGTIPAGSATTDVGPSVIKYQSFEGSDSWGYTANPTAFNSGGDVWDVVTSSFRTFSTIPSDATHFWGIQDLNSPSGTSNWGTLTFNSVDVSTYSSVEIKFDYEVEGYDNGDDVKYEAFFDGTSQGEVLLVDGSSNKNQDGTVIISVPENANNVYIVVSVKQNGDDYAGFDNFKVEGVLSSIANPASFTSTTSSDSQIDLSATANGNGDNIMVAYNSTSTFGTPSGSYTAGNAISGGGTVHYVGSAASLTNHSSLSSGTKYYYKTWSVDGSNDYSNGITDNATTYKAEPTNHVSSFAITTSSTTNDKIVLTWADNDGAIAADKFLIKASAVSYADIVNPVDGTEEADATLIKNIAHGTETVTFTGLTASTTYYFKIFPYTNSGSDIDFKIGSEPQVSETTEVAAMAPAIGDLVISEIVGDDVDGNNNDNGYVEIYNNNQSNSIDLTNVYVRYYNSNPGAVSSTYQLSGSISSKGHIVVTQNATNFNNYYTPVTADFEAGGNFFFNGGDDGVDIIYDNGAKAITILDAFNDNGSGASSWTWDDANVYERKSTGTDGAIISNWNENTSGTGTPKATNDGQALPIDLLSFTTKVHNNSIVLLWQTATEENNDYFTIERSYNAKDFAEVVQVAGAGNSNQILNYRYNDVNADLSQTIYYKLKQTDYDGKYTYSNIISVNSKSNVFEIIDSYANNGIINISINSNVENAASIELYDITGSIIYNNKIELKKGINSYKIDATKYAIGLYFIRVGNNVQTLNTKLIIK